MGNIIYIDKAHVRKLDIKIQDERNVSLKVVLWESYTDKLLKIAPTNDKLKSGLTTALQFAHNSIWQESESPVAIDPSIIYDLMNMKDVENPIAQNFWMAIERFKESAETDVKLCLMGRRSCD
ncbi:hypothetical protein OROMI_006456 [Orobanche minor]